MSYIYRCSKCRTRNTFNRPARSYTPIAGLPKLEGAALRKELKENGTDRCRHCNHYHFYPDKERVNRLVCRCGGFHYPHRPGSSFCDSSPRRDLLRALRDGATPAQIMDLRADLAWSSRGTKTNVCPF